MEYQAIHRYADMSARKIRPFATLIRGRPADEALELLRFLPNKSARLLEAGAQERPGQCRGPRRPRHRRPGRDRVARGRRADHEAHHAAGRGTAYPIKRRYSHIHVTLSDGSRKRPRRVTRRSCEAA